MFDLICPNINLPEWKYLVKVLGSTDGAYDVFAWNNYNIPTIRQIDKMHEDLITSFQTSNKETLKERLQLLPYFKLAADGEIYLKNNQRYNEAASIIGKINSKGVISVKLFSNSQKEHRVIIEEIDRQEEIYDDLPENKQKSKENKLLLEGFKSFYQQNEAVNVMFTSFLAYYNANKDEVRTFQGAIKNWEEKITKLKESSTNPIYTTLLNNTKDLSFYVRLKLQKLKLINKPKLVGTSLKKSIETTEEDQEEGIEGVEEVGSLGQDEWVFQYDSKDNALQSVKKFLSTIPKTNYKLNENGEGVFLAVQSIIPGEPSYINYDEVYEQLKAILAGTENTWEAVETELLLHEKGKPFINSLFKLFNYYKGDKEQLKRQFVSTMSSTYSGFKTVLIKYKKDREGNTIGYYFDTIDTDQGSIEKIIKSKWQGNFKRQDFFKEVDGNLELNPETVIAYRKRGKEVQANPTKENVNELLEALGINIADTTLETLVNGQVNKLNLSGQFTEKGGLFYLINQSLSGKQTEETVADTEETVNNPYLNNSGINALSKIESYNTDYYYSNTFKDGENNTVYSYTFNKFLTREFNKLLNDENHVKELLDITFNKPITNDDQQPIYNSWLYLLQTNPVFKTIFNISPLDTLKIKGEREGTKLSAMSELDLEITKIGLLQNSGQRKKGIGEETEGTRIIKYLLSVPDKTTSYIIQGVGQEVKILFDPKVTNHVIGKNTSIDKKTVNALYSIAASEHNRILSQQARKSSNKAYNKGSEFFFFFPTLNDIVKNSDNQVRLPTDILENGETVEQAIKKELIKIINQDIADKIAEWKRLGIAGTDNSLILVDDKYKEIILKPQGTTNNQQLIVAAADFVINNTLANFNTHQLFIEDPAIYFKDSVEKTWENISKRLTNFIAPAKDGMIDETNKHFLSVKLQDRVSAALNHAQLQERLKTYYTPENFPYKEIKGTDAQEYITLTEQLKRMKMYGEITTEFYDRLIDKIKKEGDNLILTKEDLDKVVFVPEKPVYSGREISKEDDVVYREYVKSSSFVLLPEFTKGLEIDKLRKGLEKLEKGNLSARAVFDTGTKLGGKGSINIWNTDGTIKDDLDLTNYAVQLNREDFGIQQEVPYDETKDEILRSTQVFKLLFDSLGEVEDFKYHDKIYTGKNLNSLYTELQKQLYEQGLTKLEQKILKNHSLDMKSVIPFLANEGIKREYSPAQQSFLQSNESETDFEIPFWAHVNNDKEQAMLTSMWTNNVLKQKVDGASYVLVSEEGMQGKSTGVTYVGSVKTETVNKDTVELLTEELSVANQNKKVSIKITYIEDNSVALEEIEAGKALKDLKEQNERLDALYKCLTK